MTRHQIGMLHIIAQMLFLRKQLGDSTLIGMLLLRDQGICVCTAITLRAFFFFNHSYLGTSSDYVNM